MHSNIFASLWILSNVFLLNEWMEDRQSDVQEAMSEKVVGVDVPFWLKPFCSNGALLLSVTEGSFWSFFLRP